MAFLASLTSKMNESASLGSLLIWTDVRVLEDLGLYLALALDQILSLFSNAVELHWRDM